MDPEQRLIAEQVRYYRERAPEYDDWFLRRGRYDRGAAHGEAWAREVARVEGALFEARPEGRVLELACGTGLWTRQLVKTAGSVTAVDASPEVIERNRVRLASDRVDYVQADLFGWRPPAGFDFAFFGFWLSHVPPARFEEFWQGVRASLRPGGRAFFVDSLPTPAISTANAIPGEADFVMQRELYDGRRFRVIKVFYEPATLEERLARLGWSGRVHASGEFFVYGCLTAS